MDACEEIPQLCPHPFVRVAPAVILCRDAVCIEGLHDKTGRIRIDLDHADMPCFIEYEVKAREPRRKPKCIRNAQVGEQLARQIHRARKVVGRILEHRCCLAEDAKQPCRACAQFIVELLRKCLHGMRWIAVGIVAVLNVGEDGGIKCINVGVCVYAFHSHEPPDERMPA